MPFKRDGGSVDSSIYWTPQYRRARALLVSAFKPGDPCCLCGHAILTKRYVEAQHNPGTDTLLGLAHGTRNPCPTCGQRCNQVDGAKRGRARQNTKVTRLKWLQGEETPRPWLAQDDHPCPVCGEVVVWSSQRCCSRACAVQFRRSQKPVPQPVLCECGQSVPDARSPRCDEHRQRWAPTPSSRPCVDCSIEVPFAGAGRPQIRCESCRLRVKRERKAAWRQTPAGRESRRRQSRSYKARRRAHTPQG